MLQYVVRRLLQSVVVLWGVTLLVFALLFLSGDPAALLVSPTASRAEVDALRHAMGFDRPWPVQYADFIVAAAHGDFGESLRQHQPALPLVVERLPATFELAIAAMLLSLLIALPVGVLAATRRNSLADQISMAFALLGQSIPIFWLGLMLMLVFSVNLRWLPVAGRGEPGNLGSQLLHLVLPALTLSTFSIARNARMLRSSLLDVLGQEYIQTARAKGLTEHRVVLRHAVKNALIPVVTLLGLEFGTLLGGSVITETIFAWPGVGRLTINAIQSKDFPVLTAAVTLLALSFVILNLLVDLLYGFLDPRIRHG